MCPTQGCELIQNIIRFFWNFFGECGLHGSQLRTRQMKNGISKDCLLLADPVYMLRVRLITTPNCQQIWERDSFLLGIFGSGPSDMEKSRGRLIDRELSLQVIQHMQECSHMCKGFLLESTYSVQGQELMFFQNTLPHMPIRRESYHQIYDCCPSKIKVQQKTQTRSDKKFSSCVHKPACFKELKFPNSVINFL